MEINGIKPNSERGILLKNLDKADGLEDGIINKSSVIENQEIISKLSDNDKNILSKLQEGEIQNISIKFVDEHNNDVTVLSATRMGQNAVTWLTPTLIENWKTGEPIDLAIDRVSKLQNNGNYSHHPSLFVSNNEHNEVKEHHSIIIANSDYDKDGRVATGIEAIFSNDLADVKKEGRDLLEKYKEQGYNTLLYENVNDEEIIKAISTKIKMAESGDEVVIHYSGHGSPNGIEGVNGFVGQYINPYNDSLFNSEIQKLVNDAKEKGIKVVVILDSCQSGYSTDYIRHYSKMGLEDFIDSAGKSKSLTSEEKEIVSNANKNMDQIKQLSKELDDLYFQPIEIEFNGETKTVKFNKVQDYIDNQIKDFKDKNNEGESIHSLKLEKISLNHKIRMLEIDIKYIDLKVKKDDPELKEQKIAEINAKISELQDKLRVIESKINNVDSKDKEISEQIDKINNKINQHFEVISQKEREMDSLISEIYNNLSELSIYSNSETISEMEKFGFNVMPSYFAHDGAMLTLGVDYNLFELNRFQDMSLGLSGSVGQNTFKLTETLNFGISKKVEGELGFSQTFRENDKTRNWLHLGTNYKLSNKINLSGGIEVNKKFEDKADRFNPYLGVKVIL